MLVSMTLGLRVNSSFYDRRNVREYQFTIMGKATDIPLWKLIDNPSRPKG